MSISISPLSASLAPPLMALYSVECLVSLLCLGLGTLLYETFRQFSVFHDHLRTICVNVTCCILVASGYSCIRAINGIYQLVYPVEWDDTSPLICPFTPRVPIYICILLCVFSLSLAVERLYASLNYMHYEQQNVNIMLRRLLLVPWTPGSIVLVWMLLQSFDQAPLTVCVASDDTLSPLNRNIGAVITAFFQLVFAAIFHYLKLLNKARQTEYIKHHYRSLSTRFQIGENLRTCGLMRPLHLLSAFFFVGQYLADLYIRRNGHTDDVQKESLYLFLPIYCLLFPIIFVGNDTVLRRKFCTVTHNLFTNAAKEKALLEEA